jgi:hypothetical protein
MIGEPVPFKADEDGSSQVSTFEEFFVEPKPLKMSADVNSKQKPHQHNMAP